MLAVPIGEMATVRRDARANGDCRRRQRLHAAVPAERDGGDSGGGTTRHRARMDAARDREPRSSGRAGQAEKRDEIGSRGRRRLARGPARFRRGAARKRSAGRLARRLASGRIAVAGVRVELTYRRTADRTDGVSTAAVLVDGIGIAMQFRATLLFG